MTQKVYVFIVDGGDGSASVQYTRDPDFLDRMWDEDPESYGLNEGGYSDILEFPDDLDLEECGFSFYEGEEE